LLHGARPADPALWVLAGVTTTALALLLIALARPQRGTTHSEEVVETRDVVLTLDVSLSMDSSIAAGPGRALVPKLTMIQRAAADFIRSRPHDRVGLLVFGDDTFGLWPLSRDTAILQDRLQHLKTLLPAELRGTHVARALEKSLEYLGRHGQARSKVLILLTDGLDTLDTTTQARLLQRLHHSRVTLYVLGIDLTESTQIMQFIRQAQAQYFNATRAEELERIFHDIDRLETSTITGREHTTYHDLYAVFAASGLGLLLVSLLLKSIWVVDV
jgi:Ca-activated chloride channel family protein